MAQSRLVNLGLAVLVMTMLAACGNGGGGLFSGGNPFSRPITAETQADLEASGTLPAQDRETIWDLFNDNRDPNVSVEVNRYLWNASLEILDFMPIEGADPFSGIIIFGYGTPPGGGRAYRATVYITDPALDARSLRVALQTRNGAVNRETARQVEDAILTRARQLRIRDSSL